MKLIIEMYDLTFMENKIKSKKKLREIHLDDLNHFVPAIKHIIEEEFEDKENKIVLRLKKFKNGRHKIYYNLIESKALKRDVINLLESSYPIIC
jgi:hypothetical protein